MTPMKRVGRDASAHENVVKSAERLHQNHKTSQRRRQTYKRNGRTSRTKVSKPDPRAWKAALKLAKGDPHRLVVNKDDLDVTGHPSVTVLNNPKG